MRYLKLCEKLPDLSVIALGTAEYGTGISENESFELMECYFTNGGNVIDTAHVYGNWYGGELNMSEKTIGKWIKHHGSRLDMVISTKGAHPELGTMTVSRLSHNEIIYDFESSLECLDNDYVDIYWLHRDDEAVPVGEIMETLHSFVEHGKARCIGVSNWHNRRIDEANRYAQTHGLTQIITSQIDYALAKPNLNMIDPTLVVMDDTEYEYYKRTKMCVFAYTSQARGYFTKLAKGQILTEYHNDENIKMFEKVKILSEQNGKTISQIAISQIINTIDFPVIALAGCRNIDQLNDTLGAV